MSSKRLNPTPFATFLRVACAAILLPATLATALLPAAISTTLLPATLATFLRIACAAFLIPARFAGILIPAGFAAFLLPATLATALLPAAISTTLLPATVSAQPHTPGDEAIGRWNLTIERPSGSFPGWLEINKSGFRTLTGSYVGYEGSARPVSHIIYSEQDGTYSFAIPPQWKDPGGNLEFEFSLADDRLNGSVLIGNDRLALSGVRAPDLLRDAPPVWGEPYSLLDDHMSRWIIPENNRFRMKDGILVNEAVGGNLITKETFDDLKLHATFRYPDGSNSGIYLRGRYEVQIMDNYGEPVSNLILGGIYGFLEPSVNAAKRGGEWQTMDITLVGRHVTVVLNGTTVISNRIIPGITGGALDSNEGKPGPIMIQGDHGPVEFKKLVITPAREK